MVTMMEDSGQVWDLSTGSPEGMWWTCDCPHRYLLPISFYTCKIRDIIQDKVIRVWSV